MSAARYRKKPVVIEAAQFDGDNGYIILGWIQDSGHYASHVASSRVMMVQTLEGEMRVDEGDWVICGVKGEFYPCKPDIFAASYEAMSP